MASEIKVDTVSEKTSGSGVTIDGLLIKDGGISGDVSLIGTTPTFTIGDAGAEDAALVFDGNAQDFYIALDDSADDLLIGLGSTVGTTAAIGIDENLQVNVKATTASSSATTGALIVGGGAGIAADLSVGDDLRLISDSSVLSFGADSEITVTHEADVGLKLKHTATADDKPIVLTLQTGETDLAQDDVIGKIAFQAPDEGTGTDAILVSAAIQARAEGDHSSSSNATSIDFLTGASEAAAKKLSITSAGHLVPSADNTNDIGTSSLEFKDGYFDGTLYCDVLNLAGTNHTSISAGLTGIDDQSSSNDDQITISDTAVIINEDSDDLDFRVESNGNANMLFISGGNDVVGVGAEGDLGVGLHIKSADSGASVDSAGDELVIEGSGASGMTILSGTSSSGSIYFGDSGDNDIGYVVYNHSTNALMLGANTGEGLRVTGDGVVSIGTTETGYSNLTQANDNGIILTDGDSSIFATNQGVPLVCARTNNDTNNRDIIIFNRQGSTQGEISGGNNNVNYGSNSDYRLKENVTYTWDATTRLKQLKPARFNFIADETNTLRDGFIAHEVSSIVPEAISGEKDGMAVETMYTADDVETQGDNPSKKVGDTKTYSSSEIKAQTIDPSKLVPLLVKTIQELEARVKTLEDA